MMLVLYLALSTLTGGSVYMAYSDAASKEALYQAKQANIDMQGVSIRFGWSLVLAWISGGAQLVTSFGFLLACRLITKQREVLEL
ncbi:hypothetical protein UPYG_G00094950 [Umbra pygmaea]|uniref:Uncharacterized protein n=1 Tax=Umbra pygmaea TaxID=75934 RepID=A0ABD0XK50_UMBPY